MILANVEPSPSATSIGSSYLSGEVIDCDGFGAQMVGILTIGYIDDPGPGEMTVYAQESDTGDAPWYNVASFPKVNRDSANVIHQIDFTRTRRYLRSRGLASLFSGMVAGLAVYFGDTA